MLDNHTQASYSCTGANFTPAAHTGSDSDGPLHGDITFGHFRMRPFGRSLVGSQKCIAMIERKALIVLLFTNASDYSSETTIFVRYKHIDLSMQVLLE